jgi:DNA-binding CsgD family transcriptional regulator
LVVACTYSCRIISQLALPVLRYTLSETQAMASALTPREKDVVRLASLGCTVHESAKILKLAPSTVDNHKARAMAKLGTDKAALLTRLAIELKVTSMTDKLTPAEKRKSGRKNDGWNQK